MATSRLQKLLKLLESTNESSRKTAAEQICNIAKAHPSQLVSLTRKVHSLLYHANWDTRVAAASTLTGLAEAFPHHSVQSLALAAGGRREQQQTAQVHVDLAAFDLDKVLGSGAPLLASGGQEFDVVDSSLPVAERVAKQRQLLRERIGLDKRLDATGFGDTFDTDELVNEEDIAAALQQPKKRAQGGKWRQATPDKQAAASLLRSDSLSARERNKLKRKTKALQRQDSLAGVESKGRVGELVGEGKGSSREASPSSPLKLTPSATAAAAGASPAAGAASTNDEQAAEQDLEEWRSIESGSWPFQRIADQLCCDILNPLWTVRHGATAGLRELLREQAASAAVEAPMQDTVSGWASPGGAGLRRLAPVTPDVVECAAASNSAWLEDVITHLLCVLALDRFADYVSDQVVVPVRETAAQALGAALQPTDLATLQQVLQLLSSMHKHSEWSVRHGAFTGVKYLLASRPEAVEQLLPLALPVLLMGLQDRDDSVQAAAAEALVPMAHLLLLSPQASEFVTRLRSILWTILASMEEELSVATSSCLSLLAALYSPPAPQQPDAMLAYNLTVLWPFLLHTLSSARLAAATCLARLAAAGGAEAGVRSVATAAAAEDDGVWLKPVAAPCLRLLLQCMVMERDGRVRQALLQAWRALLQHCRPSDIQAGLSAKDLRAMLAVASTACGQALDTCQLVVPLQGRLVAWGSTYTEKAGLCVRPSKRIKREPDSAIKQEPGFNMSSSSSGLYGESPGSLAGLEAMGGGSSGLDPEVWAGAGDQESAVRMRLLAGQAMGQLCATLQGQEPSVLPGLVLQQLQQLAASSRVTAALIILHWLQQTANSAACTAQGNSVAVAAAGAANGPIDGSAAAAAAGNAAAAAPIVRPSTVELAGLIGSVVPEQLPDTCLMYLSTPGAFLPSYPATEPYAELAPMYARMRKELYTLVDACLQAGVILQTPGGIPLELVTAEAGIAMAASVPSDVDTGAVATAKLSALHSAQHLQLMEQYLHTSACLVMASVVVASGRLPAKLNCIIQNLMAGLRREACRDLQEVAAVAVAELMAGCSSRQPCPNDKLLKNLCTMVCSDPAETPSAAAAAELSPEEDVLAARLLSHSQASTSAPGAGNSATAAAAGKQTAASPIAAAAAPIDSIAATSRVGAEFALVAICRRFGASVFQHLPSLWTQMTAALAAADGENRAPTGDPQGLIHAMQVVKVVVPAMHPSLAPQGLALLPHTCACLRHSNAAVRLAAARCLASLAAAQPEAVLPQLLKRAVPLLDGTNPVSCRLGAVEVLATLVTLLDKQLVPYTVMLVVPLLRRMSDVVAAVRRKAALCFGSLTALLPLAQGLPLPAGLDEQQGAAAQQDGEFLSQLLDNKKVQDYKLPVQLKVELRRYQQEGVNWLAFLRRFGLSGILADDMGLGKTLQSTIIMACSAAERQAAHSVNSNNVETQQQEKLQHTASVASNSSDLLPSLVVCPSTLVGHWAHEITKYVDSSVLRPLAISGTPYERQAAAKQLCSCGYNVAIISYESVRSLADWAAGVSWDYVILDEGHVIRSTKSKLAQAVKRLQAQHRLVLSGTPIQNSALELWSLFDFLMPGFLGAERDFNARFGRVVNAAKYSKKGSREQEAGTLALDALHKQVMPFILRRTKAQVLQDLPPKIITDVLCNLSPIQQQLYEDFSTSQALSEVTSGLKQQQQQGNGAVAGSNGGSSSVEGKAAQHVFSALLYLRKLCSHPLLALDWSVLAHREACQKVLNADTQQAAEAALQAVEHAPKLLALQDILVQCGLVSADAVAGGSAGSKSGSKAAQDADDLIEGSVDSGHRLLVFAQLKGMLSLVENLLLKPLGVSTLRLDGGVDASARFGVVQRFNSDPTIQVLLLTTHVGGLGLNLTSADTVVFLEHDWNPMKDLQAMDRAHRIGQTRTVNIYRLLMQDTLEERIMSLQQFKLDVANAVVNQDNMSMSAMDTAQLLDLFGAPTAAAGKQQQEEQAAGTEQAQAVGVGLAATGRKKSTLQFMLDGMGELWDDSQYQSEFDMKGFMQKLAKKKQQ